MSNQKTNTTTKPSVNRGPMGGGRNLEKPKNFGDSIKKLTQFSKPYWVAVLVAVVLSVVGTILTLTVPNRVRDITSIIEDGLFTGIDLPQVTSIGITLIVVIALSALFTYAQGFIMATVTQKISKRLRKQISSKINKLPLKYLDSKTHGDVLSRVTNDVDTIGQTLNNSLVTLVSALTLLFGSLILMYVNNWIMASTAIVASLLGIVLMGIIMSKSQKYFVSQQKSLGQMNGHIEEIYTGHNVVKAYNAEKEASQTFEKINNNLFVSAWKSQFISGIMFPIMGFIGNLGYVLVCVVGAALVFNGQIEFSVIVAFMIYIRYFTQPLGQLSQAMTNLQASAAASERVFEFLEEPELQDESSKQTVLTNIQGNVEFKHVKFGYNADKEIIHNFSIQIKKGQKVAIVGPTGAGKTTIVNLLMRFYEVNSGQILVDGVALQDITREQVHNMFGMVLQDSWLFDGTIEENIIYSKQGVTHEDVVAACKAVGLDHFVHTLPKGYDTVLNENSSISEGQKQLLTIARAMVQNSPMLILDEATSSVDTRTEILIQKAMDELTKGRTSFVIAHRLSTIKNADVILVMKDGDIVEHGNHQVLMKQNGFYADLYNSQFDVV